MTATNQQAASRRTYEMVHGRDRDAGASVFIGDGHALMTVREPCADARISPATFYRLVKNDPNFPTLVKIGGGTRVRSDAWRQYLDRLASAKGEAA